MGFKGMERGGYNGGTGGKGGMLHGSLYGLFIPEDGVIALAIFNGNLSSQILWERLYVCIGHLYLIFQSWKLKGLRFT